MAINWSVVTWEPQFSILFFNSYCPSSEAPRLLLVLAAPGLIMLNCWWPLCSQQSASFLRFLQIQFSVSVTAAAWTLDTALGKQKLTQRLLLNLTDPSHAPQPQKYADIALLPFPWRKTHCRTLSRKRLSWKKCAWPRKIDDTNGNDVNLQPTLSAVLCVLRH